MIKPDSLKELKSFTLEVRENQEKDQMMIFVVGSKNDSVSELYCQNVEREIYDTVKEINAEFWTVSSLTGKNIINLFSRIAALCFLKIIKTELEVIDALHCKEENGVEQIVQLQLEETKMKKKRKVCIKCSII